MADPGDASLDPNAPPDDQMVPGRGVSTTSPWQKIVQGVLTLLVLVLIFGYVLPGLADWDDVAAAFEEITVDEALLLALMFVLIEFLKGAEQSVAIPPLPVGQAVVASEASTAISNIIPGPSGTAMRLYIYRTWGLTSADFARGWFLTSAVNNGIILVMPSIALAIYAAQGDVTQSLVILALIGTVISLILIALIVGALRSEGFARRMGRLIGRIVTWAKGLVHKPTPTDFEEVTVRFRDETIETLRHGGVLLIGVIFLKYMLNALTLVIALRSVGVPKDPLTVAGIFAAYAVVRLVTVVEITPGGVGVVEVAYAAALTYVAGTDAYHAQIVAAVLLFRVVTYIAPIPAGGICYVIWRRKESWKKPIGAESRTETNVVGALIDRKQPDA